MGRTDRPGVGIGHEGESPFETVGDDRGEKLVLGLVRCRLLIGIPHGVDIPVPHPDAIGLGQIELTLLGDRHQRRRVIHHRRPTAVGARGKVVGEPEGVADLVSRELPDSGQSDLNRVVRATGAGVAGPHEPLHEQSVVPHPKGTEGDMALDHLAGPGIDDPTTVGPTPGRPVNPLDDVVPHVEGMGSFGEDLDAVGVVEAGGLERLDPPRCALDQRGPNRFRRPSIDEVDDGLDDR